jgi:predicted nucleic acid-binding protein
MPANAPVANALIDTGAILALLDRTDRWHNVCVDAFRQLRLPLLTSEAVLAELFHLVGDSRHEMEAAWKFARSGALTLGIIEPEELTHLHSLMSRYWDRPMARNMDFADATLVYLARRESLSVILTVDQPDFATYRIEGKRQFRVLPNKRP